MFVASKIDSGILSHSLRPSLFVLDHCLKDMDILNNHLGSRIILNYISTVGAGSDDSRPSNPNITFEVSCNF